MSRDEKSDAILRMQSFIEDHLTRTITMQELARVANYSPWYAARLFKEYTGKSPFDYIRLRRLSAAARNLSTHSGKVIDVAFDFVFDTHEGFSRAFTRQFGISPRKYRADKPPLLMFLPERMKNYYINHTYGEKPMSNSTGSNTVFTQVIERPARKLVLKRGIKATHYFEYCEEVGCEVWEQLGALKDTLHEPMGLWLPDRFRLHGTSSYVQGVEVAVDYTGPIPEGFDIIELPSCLMMVFQGQQFKDEEFEQAITSLWDVIKEYRPETYGFAWDDDAGPRFQLEPVGYRGYIEGRPVKRIDG